MSFTKIFPNGTKTFTVAASDKLTVKSLGGVVSVTKTVGYPNHPNTQASVMDVSDLATSTSSAFSAATEVTVTAGEGGAEYATGTEGGIFKDVQPAPNALNATGSVTAAMLLGGILTSTTAAAVAGTVVTGTALDAACDMAVDESFDLSIIATGANAFTLTANTGITIVGTAVVATVTSGLFRFRKTAANTFVAYRLA